MEQLQSLSLARKLILGGAILLLIDSFLDWQQVSAEVFGSEVTVGQSAWHGLWGVVLGLLTIALIAWVLARAFGLQLSDGLPEGLIVLVVAAVILLCAVIKALTDDAVHWPAWVGVVLALVIGWGAWQNFQETNDEVPARMQTMTAGAGTTGAASPPTTPAAPTPTDRAETTPPPPPPGDAP